MELLYTEANGVVGNWAVIVTCPGNRVTGKHPSKGRKGWVISPLVRSLHLDRNAAKQNTKHEVFYLVSIPALFLFVAFSFTLKEIPLSERGVNGESMVCSISSCIPVDQEVPPFRTTD